MACGYKDDHSEQKDPFWEIRGDFRAQTERGYGSEKQDDVKLVACPECGTVRVKHWRIPDEK
jgi:hypothetical protein